MDILTLFLPIAIAAVPPGCLSVGNQPLISGAAITGADPTAIEGRLVCNEAGQGAIVSGGKIGHLIPIASAAPPKNPAYSVGFVMGVFLLFGGVGWMAWRHQYRQDMTDLLVLQGGSALAPLPPYEPGPEPRDSPPVSLSAFRSPTSDWMQDLMHYPSVLIWGAPGSGKSTFAEWLMGERQKQGHSLEILDPHREYGQWQGLNVFGDGMDFDSIDERLKAFADLVEERYRERSKQPNYQPQPLTVLAEEFTQWNRKCGHASAFFEMSVSDIRKINCHVVYVSHNRTLTALGGSKGLAATRDSALLELELLARVDPSTGKAVPAMKGLLKYPGRAAIEVDIPHIKPPDRVAPELSHTRQTVADSYQPTKRAESGNSKRPSLPANELMMQGALLAEWVAETGITEAGQVYEKWQSRKHGFSRPEIRYLLSLIHCDR